MEQRPVKYDRIRKTYQFIISLLLELIDLEKNK
jgi:hypothetical protein